MINTFSYGDENDVHLKSVVALSRTYLSFTRTLQVFLKTYGLTVPQFGVLESLYHLGPLKICELIHKNLSTSGNMTVVIRNLEKEGWIKKSPDDEDKRSYKVSLTEQGAQIIEEAFLTHLHYLKDFFHRLTMDEKQQLLQLLKKLNGL
ncbi:MarR family transcriptional regulator [Petrocella sp. FN5]|uniref:MarR family transcriptional regulator n=1 Tax=Petrocella sp. FN5 TaxID=3032002 RepID=UPI0023DB32E3|nr:MarR family transcriptional regulator [Petrocella sp. FN5]MDF1617182.1 MarR family transcriptional regulator [Petrocella sp. FN5]